MIIDIASLESGTDICADVCIIGGGAAAIAMAQGFADSSLNVCILESGGLGPEPQTQALAAGANRGLPYFPIAESRARLLGGSTYRWGARGAPMTEVDFQARSWVPYSGWPIGLRELAPYYRRAERLIGMCTPFSYDENVWDAFPIEPPDFDSDSLRFSAFQFGKILLFGKHYRERLRRSKNIHVYLHANVTNLQCHRLGSRLEHVDMRTLKGSRHRVQAQFFVLACGGIDNARLLLLSNTVHRHGLCNEHDLVGRFFMEHPTCSIGSVVTDDAATLLDCCSPGMIDRRLVEVGMALSPQLQESRGCLNAIVRVQPSVSGDATQALRELLWDLKHGRMPREVGPSLMQVLRDPLGLAMNACRHATGRPIRYRADALFAEFRSEQEPNPESRVTLAEEKDQLGMRTPCLNWQMTRLDRYTAQVAADTLDKELRRLKIGRLELADWLRQDDCSWPQDLVGGRHHMGTTRMATKSDEGIVDSDCKAYALDNLYIAGSSVFPTAGYVNPTLTLVALAFRLADHLKTLHARAHVASA